MPDETHGDFSPSDVEGRTTPLDTADTNPQSGKETVRGVTFDVTRHIETPPDAEAAAKQGILMVWEKNVGEPTSTNINFAGTVTQHLKNGESVQVDAVYTFDDDTFNFALDTIRTRYPNLSLDKALLLLGAHEAKHRVQIHQGDTPPSSSGTIATGAYHGDRHEDETWQEALHVFKHVHPTTRLSFTIGSHQYQTPEVSKYNKS